MSKNLGKYNQQYRKALKLMWSSEEFSELTNLNYDEFYVNAILYEFSFTIALLNYSLFSDTSDNSNVLLSIRRLLECSAYYIPYIEKKLEKINLQVFKIQAQNREVGEKEAIKFKKALKLKKCDINDAIKNNNFLFLHGVYASEFSYRNFINETYDKNNNEMTFIYDYLSLRTHQTSVDLFDKKFHILDTQLINDIKRFCPKVLSDSLKKIKQLPKISLIDTEKEMLKKDEGLIVALNNALVSFLELIGNSELQYFSCFIDLVWSFIYSSLFLLNLESYRGVVATFKPFIEKVAVLNSLLKMKPNEANQAYKDYNLCSVYVVYNSMVKMKLINENSLDNDLRNIYLKHFSQGNKDAYSSFKIKIESNPSYVITRRVENYSSSVERFFTDNFTKDKKELMEAYLESVILSHCDGFLVFRHEKDYTDYAKIVVKFSLDYLRYLIDFFFGNKFHYLLDNIQSHGAHLHEILTSLINKVEENFVASEEVEKEKKKTFLPFVNIKDYLD